MNSMLRKNYLGHCSNSDFTEYVEDKINSQNECLGNIISIHTLSCTYLHISNMINSENLKFI